MHPGDRWRDGGRLFQCVRIDREGMARLRCPYCQTMHRYPMAQSSEPHEVRARCGGGRVMLVPEPA